MLTSICFAMMLAILYHYMVENCEWVEEEPDQPWNMDFDHPQVVRAGADLTKVYEALAAQRKT